MDQKIDVPLSIFICGLGADLGFLVTVILQP